MRILKIIVIIVVIVVVLFFGVLYALLVRVPTRILRVFNHITAEEAIKLAEDCQIKTTGEQHIIGGIDITLTNGSYKYLEDKYEISNHRRVYDQNYKRFQQLIADSKTRCGFPAPFYME